MSLASPPPPATWGEAVRHIWARLRRTDDKVEKKTEPDRGRPEHFEAVQITGISIGAVLGAVLLAIIAYLLYWYVVKSRTKAGGRRSAQSVSGPPSNRCMCRGW